MRLVSARCLEDPQALWRELEGHWRQGSLVGLAPPPERPQLMAAVLGGAAADGDDGRAADQRRPTGQPGRHDPQRNEPGPTTPKPPWTGAGPAGGAPDDTHGQLLADAHGRWGAALVLGSGGSSGGRRWCLQPLSQLQASARACGQWLEALGLDPGRCLLLDALPLHHVSGLMPLIRARQWQAELRWLPPPLLRHGAQLAQACPLPENRPVLLSLVPTQLQRLLDSPEASDWLRRCALIWVGGASLSPDLAARARRAGLPLAPCYGATETAAMVCALPPQRFLAGEPGCGPPLSDVTLRLDGDSGAIAVRSDRISPGWFAAGRLHPFRDADGWWRSGDAGTWQPARDSCSSAAGTGEEGRPQASAATSSRLAAPDSLVILGRLDGAIHSGGETVFPDQVRQRLLELIGTEGLPVAELLLLPESDALWGERLVALVRWRRADGTGGREEARRSDSARAAWLSRLADLARALPAPQRPRRWLHCPELAPNATGKWQQQRWRQWLQNHDRGEA